MEFSWKRILKITLIVLAVAALAGGVYFLAGSRQAKIAWAEVVSDRHEHFLACQDLPFYLQAQRAVEQHQDTLAKLYSAGAAGVNAKEINCLSFDGRYNFLKGDILITYKNSSQRKAIEKILGSNFFGVPYRGEPVK